MKEGVDYMVQGKVWPSWPGALWPLAKPCYGLLSKQAPNTKYMFGCVSPARRELKGINKISTMEHVCSFALEMLEEGGFLFPSL